MPPSLFRVAGGYTTFAFNGQNLLYVTVITDTAPQPVATPQPIHPLGEEHPIEIAFPVAHGTGTLVLQMVEQWESEVWQQLPGFANIDNIVDVFRANIASGAISCTKTITLPNGGSRIVTYYGCVITAIDESETVNIGTITLPKNITIMYTHKTRSRT